MVGVEGAQDDAGAECASWVEAAAGVVDAEEFCNEEGKADSDWSDEGGTVFLGGEHEDCEDELGCEEHLRREVSIIQQGRLGSGEAHLNEQPLNHCSSTAQGGANIEWPRKHARDHGRRCDGAQQLRDDDKAAARVRHSCGSLLACIVVGAQKQGRQNRNSFSATRATYLRQPSCQWIPKNELVIPKVQA